MGERNIKVMGPRRDFKKRLTLRSQRAPEITVNMNITDRIKHSESNNDRIKIKKPANNYQITR